MCVIDMETFCAYYWVSHLSLGHIRRVAAVNIRVQSRALTRTHCLATVGVLYVRMNPLATHQSTCTCTIQMKTFDKRISIEHVAHSIAIAHHCYSDSKP